MQWDAAPHTKNCSKLKQWHCLQESKIEPGLPIEVTLAFFV
jgi:hypothetical protein